MQVYGYNKERKSKGNFEFFLKMVIFGGILALVFIGSGIGLKFIVGLIIKYWIWVVGTIVVLFVGRRFLRRRKRKE